MCDAPLKRRQSRISHPFVYSGDFFGVQGRLYVLYCDTCQISYRYDSRRVNNTMIYQHNRHKLRCWISTSQTVVCQSLLNRSLIDIFDGHEAISTVAAKNNSYLGVSKKTKTGKHYNSFGILLTLRTSCLHSSDRDV